MTAAPLLLEKALRCLDGLPPFSPVLSKLLASLSDPDPSFLELSKLVEKDTLLSAHLLAIVNSAAYSRRQEVHSIRHALTLLGLSKLRNVAIGLSVARLWSRSKVPAELPLIAFNLHAVAVAMLADVLAVHLGVKEAEGAFLAGLLHDVGKLLLAMASPDDVKQVRARHEDLGETWLEAERAVWGIDHATVSAAALAHWKVPDCVRDAAAGHHKGNSLERHSLPFVIALADEQANQVGIRAHCCAEELDWSAHDSLLALPVPHARLMREWQMEWENVRRFFSGATESTQARAGSSR